MKSNHPLMKHMRHPLRTSLDHLTFNQIKLERIKQERRIDAAQKRCMALKSNHEYIDNKVDFHIKTSFTSAHSKRATFYKAREHNSLLNIDEGENIFEEDQIDPNMTNLETDNKNEFINQDDNNENEGEDDGENYEKLDQDNLSPLSITYNQGFPEKEKKTNGRVKVKCAALAQYEKKRKRAQKIRAQSLAFNRISKKKSKQDRRRKERQRKLVQSMQEKSKIIIEQK